METRFGPDEMSDRWAHCHVNLSRGGLEGGGGRGREEGGEADSQLSACAEMI